MHFTYMTMNPSAIAGLSLYMPAPSCTYYLPNQPAFTGVILPENN